MQGFLSKRGKGLGLRLGVKTSGCSGMAYKLEFVDEADEEDLSFESHRRDLVHRRQKPGLYRRHRAGFAKEGLNEGFKFNNPNVKNECGCGESFNV